ncbi:hypothetical protein [[Mycoplasma] testudinis]|uniref:hypothetical protein n=1 Tax=[Mycoplasma] testudinis TaxID=33924 RepID=UPI000488EC7F|nr:hypothetical protein [[Mycoplasma] testudinis]
MKQSRLKRFTGLGIAFGGLVVAVPAIASACGNSQTTDPSTVKPQPQDSTVNQTQKAYKEDNAGAEGIRADLQANFSTNLLSETLKAYLANANNIGDTTKDFAGSLNVAQAIKPSVTFHYFLDNVNYNESKQTATFKISVKSNVKIDTKIADKDFNFSADSEFILEAKDAPVNLVTGIISDVKQSVKTTNNFVNNNINLPDNVNIPDQNLTVNLDLTSIWLAYLTSENKIAIPPMVDGSKVVSTTEPDAKIVSDIKANSTNLKDYLSSKLVSDSDLVQASVLVYVNIPSAQIKEKIATQQAQMIKTNPSLATTSITPSMSWLLDNFSYNKDNHTASFTLFTKFTLSVNSDPNNKVKVSQSSEIVVESYANNALVDAKTNTISGLVSNASIAQHTLVDGKESSLFPKTTFGPFSTDPIDVTAAWNALLTANK